MQDVEYYRATTLDEVGTLMADTGGRMLAGGTDLIPRMRKGMLKDIALVDVSRVQALTGIREVNGQIEIGALTTHMDMFDSGLLQETAPSLLEAVRTIGCPQTRARGTLGGNLANASPAADTAPPLLVMDADIKLWKAGRERNVALAQFFTGPGTTCLEVGEVLCKVVFKKPTGKWGSSFLKLGKRKGMAISVSSAAVFIQMDEKKIIRQARVALGSVAPTPVRSSSVEKQLLGKPLSNEVMKEVAQFCLEDISPISDLRATADYRKRTAAVLVERCLLRAAERAAQRME